VTPYARIMPAPVTLPRIAWGDPGAERHALLIHGLGSNGPLMWLFGTALAEAGWYAVAVDLRGHGLAPRSTDYTLAAYGTDVAHVRREGGWDLVIGHSLGGASATLAQATHPRWARHLVLVDPAIHLTPEQRAAVQAGNAASFAAPTAEGVRAANPTWHPNDVEAKVTSLRQASTWGTDQTAVQNPDWDVREAFLALTVPTLVLAADPAVNSLFTGPAIDELVAANPHVSVRVIEGAGHSLHRDKPAETLAALFDGLAS
jgi:pimeloyl-ACP methyl ester carboxylesterase